MYKLIRKGNHSLIHSLSISSLSMLTTFSLKGTGTLGGNGYDGAIYGELTAGSMQKVINFMIERCELTNSSRFIDVGSGIETYLLT